MNTATVSASMRLNRRDSLWLAVAVLLHALLLLIPSQYIPSATDVSRVVSVSLLSPRPKVPPRESIDQIPLPAAEQALPREVPPPLPPTPADRSQEIPEPDSEVSSTEAPVTTTTAALLDFAGRYKWPSAEEPRGRSLGVFVPQPEPENWRPGITVEDNLFNGMVLPEKTEIVDRWLAADGSHNVVINTTSGETLCGRAQPYNPMNPLVEPIMTWWQCGGGGKRTFTMPERFLKSRRNAGPEDGGGYR